MNSQHRRAIHGPLVAWVATIGQASEIDIISETIKRQSNGLLLFDGKDKSLEVLFEPLRPIEKWPLFDLADLGHDVFE